MTNFTTCRTCFKPIDRPYRLFGADGEVIQGCVSKDHDGQLIPGTESARWHNRPWAKKYRNADKTLTLAELARHGRTRTAIAAMRAISRGAPYFTTEVR